MTYYAHDKWDIEGMKAFDTFRDERFNFLYLCKNCERSFDSIEQREDCKFCGHKVIELKSTKRTTGSLKQGLTKKAVYRYFCPTCERNFISTDKLAVCNECRTDYLHVYTWDMLRRRDKLQIKLNKAVKDVFGRVETRPKIGIRKISLFSSRKDEELPSY